MRRALPLPAAFFLLGIAAAQLAATGWVFGPAVRSDQRILMYQLRYLPQDNYPEAFTHRLFYQHALDERWRLHLDVRQGKTAGRELEWLSLRAEVQWQFLETTEDGWSSALRLTVDVPEGDDELPGLVRLAWTTQKTFGEHWSARAILLLGQQVGPNSEAGLLPGTRLGVFRSLGKGWSLGLTAFSRYGDTSAFGSFDGQRHQLGPVLQGRLGERTRFRLAFLAGISEAAPDRDFRLSLGRLF